MSKYYLKHTNASGVSCYRRATLFGVIGWLANLYTGESITVIRSGDDLELKLTEHPALWGTP